MYRSLLMCTMKANRNSILTGEKQRRNQHTNWANLLESSVQMHNKAQSKQEARLTPREPSRGRSGSPARCLPRQILRGRRCSSFRPRVLPPSSNSSSSPPPLSAPAGRTEGGRAAGRAGGGRPTRGVAGRWRASQVAVERRRRTVAAEQAV